ncbi:hypothetical protein CTAYLR_000928 [Chrysophaeum taylorii]|uniref:Factor of DNA methylation 1-5/IDN2 domain-containing protein n=1 Tax=Chrysophaeum taylorii TaxID=2483200 RepID=A0AAD7XQ07_9STRA|nr:hypothetical protein CTAYLR_000928 [Chrysophaeum taylorii]
MVEEEEEKTALERLRVDCAAQFESTCVALKGAFERKLAKERDALAASWAATEARLVLEMGAKTREAWERVEARLAAYEARRALRQPKPLPPLESESESPDLLKEKTEELELVYETYGPTLKAQREAQLKLVAARDAAVEAAKLKPNAVPIKIMGVLDPAKLSAVGMSPEEISALQERLRHPEFYPVKVIAEGDEVREELDRAHPELVALAFEFGDVAVDEVLRCFLELSEWNPSSRYSVSVPWDDERQAELEPADVIKRLARPARHRVPRHANRPRQRDDEDHVLFEPAAFLPRTATRAWPRALLNNNAPRPPPRGYPRVGSSDPDPARPAAPGPSPPQQASSWAVRAPRSLSSFFFGQPTGGVVVQQQTSATPNANAVARQPQPPSSPPRDNNNDNNNNA